MSTFFILAKVLGFFALPSNLLITLALIGIVLLILHFRRAGMACLIASVLLLAVFGLSPAGNALILPLEDRFPPWDPARGAPDGIIVLGGSVDPEVSEARHMPVVRNAADRMMAPVELARRYPNARVVFTGGSANLVSAEAREADASGAILEGLGIPKERLIIERNSRNTYENALFTKQLVNPKPGERWLLITSAYHMPRSIGLFRSVGFDVEAYPVDWRTSGPEDLFRFTNLAADGLSRTEVATREWIGLVAYRLIGKTGELLPGPAKD
jgi:uncharacterized SAM-binding protein YcdF (DUF218 family)